MMTDVFCVAMTWIASVSVYKAIGIGVYQASDYWRFWPVILVFVIINTFFRLYHGNPFYPSMPLSAIEEFRRLVGSSLAVHVLVIAFLGLRHEVDAISRAVVLLSAIGVAVLAQPLRDLARALLKRLDIGQINAVFVGSGENAKALCERIQKSAHIGMRLFPYDGDNHKIVEFAMARDIQILITCQDPRVLREEMFGLIGWFQQIVTFPVREVFPAADARLVLVGGMGGVEMVNLRKLKGLMIEKRIVDAVLSLVIAACTLPFFIIMPILIKLTSKGPIFYRAQRLGKNGRSIYVWKFRSMYADADQRLQTLLDSDPALRDEFNRDFKLRQDPRVTPLGKFMRKTSIDELPQLWNVIRGEMALVGPRPIVEREVPYYGADYEIFSLVKPGITGLWQATGRSDTDYAQRVALDKFYVMNWNPWMDLWIVLRTAVAVLGMKGSC